MDQKGFQPVREGTVQEGTEGESGPGRQGPVLLGGKARPRRREKQLIEANEQQRGHGQPGSGREDPILLFLASVRHLPPSPLKPKIQEGIEALPHQEEHR